MKCTMYIFAEKNLYFVAPFSWYDNFKNMLRFECFGGHFNYMTSSENEWDYDAYSCYKLRS